MSLENTELAHDAEHAGMSKARIWKVFFILLGLTVVEFVIALGVPETVMPHLVRNSIYIILTIYKAYYIVAFFMHLKFEKYALKAGIIIPLILIVYLIVLMLIEGNYLYSHMGI